MSTPDATSRRTTIRVQPEPALAVPAALHVRPATPGDAPLLARSRAGMFVDMNALQSGSALESTIVAATQRILERAIPAGEWTAWIAEIDGNSVGCGAAILRQSPPSPAFPEGGEMAYLLNFYTEPAFRRRGVATALMTTCLAWCRERGVVRVELHASPAGARVYERLGFVPREGDMLWDAAAAAKLGVRL